jgi:hypothetical protein
MNRKILLIGAVAIVLIALGGYKFKSFNLSSLTGIFSKNKILTPEEAKTKALDFIGKNLVQPGTKVEISSILPEGSLYKMELDVTGQKVTAYMTQDGKKFFPSALDVDKKEETTAASAPPAAEPQADLPKTDKPEVELFVMSYCPYGTQIEKGILPAVSALGDKIKFSLKFVDYAMHDKKELDENLRQYCIEKNQPAKLNAYLECFLKKGQGTEADCLKGAGINAAQISACVDATDNQFKVTESYNDKSTWNNGQFPPFNVNKDDNVKYGVQGSPTLVINGTVAQANSRDSLSLLKTICSAFNNSPSECGNQLSSAAPSPGFGEGTGSDSTASCGS